MIIGRSGCVIREMQTKTRTRIQIPSQPTPGHLNRIATVSGNAQGCEQVKQMIERMVMEQSSQSVMTGANFTNNFSYNQGAGAGGQQGAMMQQQGQYGQQAQQSSYYGAGAGAGAGDNGACEAEFSGGETLFLDSKACTSGNVDTDASVSVVPTAGKVVVFEHDLYHASSLLEWGTKYVLRTDVLFDVASDTPVTNRETNGSEPKAEIRKEETNMTIVELCHQLQFSSDETAVLDSLGLLDVTIESFCAPGVTMLRLMMDGIRTEKINALIQSAFELLRSKSVVEVLHKHTHTHTKPSLNYSL
mmetsp:Transcript_58968/g.68918  ORF Transcript_58968/g.68918 Transcript_58968/m.68918 type:complete len:303 (+) Transcript_58968:1612-2520(+)